jgi:hypothetical protein
MDPAIIGYMRVGYFRVGVFNDAFDSWVARLKSLGSTSVNVTRKRLTLGARDSTTGWYAKEYADSTVEMVIVQKESQSVALQAGYFVALDALGFTFDPLWIYDLIVDGSGRTWEIKTVKPARLGDGLLYYAYDLKELPLVG